MCTRHKLRGISLIELIIFIVIVSVALAGILQVMNTATRASSDPLVHKQALAIAESMLEEVELMPFTICDPDDPNAASAVTSTDCTGGPNGPNDESRLPLPLGPEANEKRGDAAIPFDNVSDYNGYTMAAGGLVDITGVAAGPSGYKVTVAVAPNGIPAVAPSPAITSDEALLVTVTVTGPDKVPVVLEGLRTRYSPRGVP